MNRGAALQWSVILIGLGALGAACTWAVVRSPALAWRVELISRKAEGDIPELSWSELRTIVSPGGRFNLKDALSEGRSLEAALTNPYTSAQDVAQGGKIFRARCAVCHGSDAKGGRGPSLTDTRYRNGNSDLAIYCILRDGVQGTAMVPTNLSALERWEEIGYLRSLQRGAAGDSSPAGPNLHAVATDEDLRNAGLKPDQWLTYSGSYAGWRYTRSAQITPANVAGLKV
ncbi:MAG TPA: c-type cytochrome, partial [Steroidobacteraceae bacterium]|nr:c-type cytochrome [Steroidobacteraceae bacterium]